MKDLKTQDGPKTLMYITDKKNKKKTSMVYCLKMTKLRQP